MQAGLGGESLKPSTRHFDLSNVKVNVHPVVILSVLDAHGRRSESKGPVAAALLGSMPAEQNVLEISDCFIMDCKWNESQIQKTTADVNAGHFEGMLSLKQRIHPHLQMVGCACMVSAVGLNTEALNEWILSDRNISKYSAVATTVNQPIHLLVDACVQEAHMSVKTFLRGPLGSIYREVPVEIHLPPAEKTAACATLFHPWMKSEREAVADAELAVLPTETSSSGDIFSLENILKVTTAAEEYARAVGADEITPDAEIGHALLKALGSEPSLRGETFTKLCQNSVQDNLALAYLSGLANLQFAIAEKLNLSFA